MQTYGLAEKCRICQSIDGKRSRRHEQVVYLQSCHREGNTSITAFENAQASIVALDSEIHELERERDQHFQGICSEFEASMRDVHRKNSQDLVEVPSRPRDLRDANPQGQDMNADLQGASLMTTGHYSSSATDNLPILLSSRRRHARLSTGERDFETILRDRKGAEDLHGQEMQTSVQKHGHLGHQTCEFSEALLGATVVLKAV